LPDKEGKTVGFSEHLLTLQELAEVLNTSIDSINPHMSMGLSHAAAELSLERDGPNKISPPHHVPLWLLFLLQFTDLLIVLLIVASLLSIAMYIYDPSVPENLYLGLILFVVIFATCLGNYLQEAKADNLMDTFHGNCLCCRLFVTLIV